MIRLLLAATILISPLVAPAVAAGKSDSDRSFILPDDDGYGLADCIGAGRGSACGQLVADAWCKTKGLGNAVAFGRSGAIEFTGSVPGANAKAGQAGALIVTCGD